MIAMLRRLRRRRLARRQIRIDQELFLREHPELRLPRRPARARRRPAA